MDYFDLVKTIKTQETVTKTVDKYWYQVKDKLFESRSEALEYLVADSPINAYILNRGKYEKTYLWDCAKMFYIPQEADRTLLYALVPGTECIITEPGWYIQAAHDIDESNTWVKLTPDLFKLLRDQAYVLCGADVVSALRAAPDDLLENNC